MYRLNINISVAYPLCSYFNVFAEWNYSILWNRTCCKGKRKHLWRHDSAARYPDIPLHSVSFISVHTWAYEIFLLAILQYSGLIYLW